MNKMILVDQKTFSTFQNEAGWQSDRGWANRFLIQLIQSAEWRDIIKTIINFTSKFERQTASFSSHEMHQLMRL